MNEGDRNKARATNPADGFSDEPFSVGLCNNGNGIARFSVELIRSFGDKIVQDYCVENLGFKGSGGWSGKW